MKMRFLRFLLICVASIFTFSVASAAEYGTTATPPTGLKVKGSVTNVDGYCTVRLQWGFSGANGETSFDGVSVNGSDVYRAFWPLAGDEPYRALSLNRNYNLFVDYEVAPGKYSYKIVMHMNYKYSLDGGTTKVDVPFDLEAYVFDPIEVGNARADLVTYDIKEVYNLRIGAENAANSVPAGKYIPTQSGKTPTLPLFDHIDFVRCGYHVSKSSNDGLNYWYFYDNGYGAWVSENDKYYTVIKAQQDASRRTTGIMWRIGDDVESLTNASLYSKKFTVSNMTSWGTSNYGPMNYFVVDQWQNIFTKFGKLATSGSGYTYYRREDATSMEYMLYPPNRYAVLHNSYNGEANPNPSNELGFTAAKANDRSGLLKIRDLASRSVTDVNPGIAIGSNTFAYTPSSQNQIGRCDMLSYRGYDALNGDGGKNTSRTFDTGFTETLFSPGRTPFLYRVKLDKGAHPKESWFRKPGDETISGVENFSMFVDGEGNENRYIHLLRGNEWRYYELDPAYADAEGDLTNHLTKAETLTYLSSAGAYSQSGGATLYVKGAIAGKGLAGQNTVQCNDLFVVTPISLKSRSTGSFQLNRATATVDNPEAKDFNVLNLTPVKIFQQREEFADGMAFNANNVCFFMAKETSKEDGLEHIYIYQYVPCVRVAKYEIVPRINPASTPITIDYKKAYESESMAEGDAKVDMNGFDRSLKFDMPDYNRDGSGNYVVKGYDIVLTDPKHNKYHYRVGPKYEYYTDPVDGVQKIGFFCEIKYMNADGTYETNDRVQQIDDKGFPVWVKDAQGKNTDIPVRYGEYVEVKSIGTDSEGNNIAPTVGEYVLNYSVPCPMPCLGTYESEISVYLGHKNVADDYIKCGSYKSTTTLSMTGENPNPVAQCYKLKDYVDGTVVGENEDDILPYRVDVSFTMPDGRGSSYEPVSHYNIWVDKTGTATSCKDPNCEKITLKKYDCLQRDAKGNPIPAGENAYLMNPDKRKDTERGFWLITNNAPTIQISNKAPGQCPRFGYEDSEGNIYPREKVDSIPGTYGMRGNNEDFTPDWGYSTIDNENEEGATGQTVFSLYFKDPTVPDPSEKNSLSKDLKGTGLSADDIIKNYRIFVEAVYASRTAYKFSKDGFASAGTPGTTSIEEVQAQQLTVSPNPAISDVTISASYEIRDVKFYSGSGALVMSESFAGDSNEVSISVDNLAPGFYYLNVNGTESVKFIKK